MLIRSSLDSRSVPTRSTSHTHLRDAFMRSLHARMQLARKNGTFTPADEMNVQAPMLTLKSLFPNTPLPKHSPLDILLSPPSSDGSTPRVLIFRDLGGLKNDWVATEFMLAYFEGDGPSPAVSSQTNSHVLISFFLLKLKASVVAGLESFGV
jgi:hypothetical protein